MVDIEDFKHKSENFMKDFCVANFGEEEYLNFVGRCKTLNKTPFLILAPVVRVDYTCKRGHLPLGGNISFQEIEKKKLKVQPELPKVEKSCTCCNMLFMEVTDKRYRRNLERIGFKLDGVFWSNLTKYSEVSVKCTRGHKKRGTILEVLKGGRCQICEETKTVRPEKSTTSNKIVGGSDKRLYILKDLNNESISKIGISVNPNKRVDTLQKASDSFERGLHVWKVYLNIRIPKSSGKAISIEQDILRAFSKKRVYEGRRCFDGSTEILQVPPSTLMKSIKEHLEIL